jgi:hypothetical protein
MMERTPALQTTLTSTAKAYPSAQPIVGAIRWDAWFGDLSPVGQTVEQTLGPKHWHYRLPFYGVELSDSSVRVRANTQAIMDQEIAYASAAGLDYWAFVTYPEDDPLSLALKLYLNSAHRSAIHFCLNLQGGWLSGPGTWQAHVARYVQYFQNPQYQTVLENRPLVYIFMAPEMVAAQRFGSAQTARRAIDALREASLSAGCGNPYLVIQDWVPEVAQQYAQHLGADAVSAYASDGHAKGAPYQDLAIHTQHWWEDFRNTSLPVVPLASTGWDPRPRIETPTPWFDYGSSDYYYEPPTPAELAAHVQAALDWVKAHPDAAEPETVLIYAWNETDEGGWLVPTHSEGTGRLEAIRKVLATRTTGTL